MGIGAEMVGVDDPDTFSMSRISMRSLACSLFRQKAYIVTKTRAVPTTAMTIGRATAQAWLQVGEEDDMGA